MGVVLVLAPHADDESLGLGGTIRRHADEGAVVHVAIVTGKGDADTHPVFSPDVFEQIGNEAREASRILGVAGLHFLNFPAVQLHMTPVWELNRAIGDLIDAVRPDTLYVPFPYDLHSDHRLVFQAANVAWRASSESGRGIKKVLCYEVPSETHWQSTLEPAFSPNSWVSLTREQFSAKLAALGAYRSQMYPFPHARSLETVRALAKWREATQGTHWAEAFVIVKDVR